MDLTSPALVSAIQEYNEEHLAIANGNEVSFWVILGNYPSHGQE